MPVMGGDPAGGGGVVVALLGAVEVGPAGGVMAPVAQPRLRVLLGLLGVTEGRVVTAEALVDGLWGEEWSPGRERNLHALVYQLRRRLAALEPGKGGARLARAGAGYRLALGPGELDVAVFRDLARLGREAARAGDAAGARELFGQASGLWRGAALADAAPLCGRLAGEAARLEEARLAVTEERVGCDLALGRHGEVAGELAGLVGEFPLRERLAALLMTALYRCGRRGEALAAFEAARRVLAGELGLDPGPELAGLQAQVLADDPALAAPAAAPGGAVPAAAEGAAAMGLPQGTVTFLFTDLEGSTRRWEAHPQEMRDALARHDAIVRGAVESHGGVVFSTMGDGMAAVFASARDAVRAVLAAQQGLGAEDWAEVTGPLAARMGLLTDEGVLGGEHYLNQPLNRCARLMAAGHGGQALVSGATELLVREDLPDGCALVDLGEHRLRDLARPVRDLPADRARAARRVPAAAHAGGVRREPAGPAQLVRRPGGRAGRAGRGDGAVAAGDGDRAGRGRQDPAGAAGRGRPAAVLPRRRVAVRAAPGRGRGDDGAGRPGRAAGASPDRPVHGRQRRGVLADQDRAAAGAGQLRAPGGRGGGAGRGHPARLPGGAHPGHQPAAAGRWAGSRSSGCGRCRCRPRTRAWRPPGPATRCPCSPSGPPPRAATSR